MNYRHILVVTAVGSDPNPAFTALRRFAPGAEQVTVLAQQPTSHFAWMTASAPPPYSDAALAAIEALQRGAGVAAPHLDIRAVGDVTVDDLTDIARSMNADLIVLDSSARDKIPLVAEGRKRTAAAVLYVSDATAAPTEHLQLLCVEMSERERRAVGNFLSAHTGPGDRALDLSDTLHGLLKPSRDAAADVIVIPRFPPAFLLGAHRGPPVLVLPSLGPAPTEWDRAIDVPDVVDDGHTIRVRAEYAIGVGRRTPIADQELAFVYNDALTASAVSLDGQCELPSGLGDPLGIFRYRGGAPVLSSIEARVSVLRATPRARLLFDAELDGDALRAIRAVTWAEPVAVRVRSRRSCRALRSRLRAAGLPPIVIDTGAVLDEGDALDVSPQLDAVRLARTGARLRAHGFDVAAIVYRGSRRPSTIGCAALRADELSATAPQAPAATNGAALPTRLDATAGGLTLPGNHIEVELDNPKARRWLFDAIETSRERVHLQVYMALDDDVGRPVEAALAAAGARGVCVRVLVDSLHGLHGSFGLHNPLLDRLSSRPGVELRLGTPLTRESSVEDLKLRDHRKLVVVDGRVALLGGRNLSHEYYTGFDEVPLTPDMAWRMVPWLDAGARVEGPVVSELERSFLQAWNDAGGAAFEVPVSPSTGTTAARVVVHRGLQDAHTVEAYLALIDSARSHVYVVNGFPLLLELQHALLRALRRGVRVRTLVGNLTPRHGTELFQGPWAGARTAATSFVQSRMDPLVLAGGECYEFVVRARPPWAASVGDIRPHVHAKTISVDGRVCAVGSANLDVTAGYWESELLLVVEDEALATALEARFDELLAPSRRVDRNDPHWQRQSEMRRWMRHWPGMLSG